MRELEEILIELAEFYPRTKFTDSALAFWVSELKKFPTETIEQVAIRWKRNESKFPDLNEFARLVRLESPLEFPSVQPAQKPNDEPFTFDGMVRVRLLKRIIESRDTVSKFGVLDHNNLTPVWQEWLAKEELKAVESVKGFGHEIPPAGYRCKYSNHVETPSEYDPFAMTEDEKRAS